MASLRVCGPKLSICCSIISVWGIVMLILMGAFLKSNSVAFAEDLNLESVLENEKTRPHFYFEMDRLYTQAAYNCFIAGCIYVVSLCFSVWQYFLNRRAVSS